MIDLPIRDFDGRLGLTINHDPQRRVIEHSALFCASGGLGVQRAA